MTDIRTRWDERDFDNIGWHDVHIHAVASYCEILQLRLDIDYILQWCLQGKEGCCHFSVAPATLIFDGVDNLMFNMQPSVFDLSINKLHQSEPIPYPNPEYVFYRYAIELHSGDISFNASGFRMYLRQPAQESSGQWLGLRQRGGICVEVPESYRNEDERIWNEVKSWCGN